MGAIFVVLWGWREKKSCTCGGKWEKEDLLLVTYFFFNVYFY